jgi:crotonobetainyl-CoA:carnitine CoA-transferase CaiB-like acyl-CoA transferase
MLRSCDEEHIVGSGQNAEGGPPPLHVVEVANYIAGPFAATLLADFGAEVVKVEPPQGGDRTRRHEGGPQGLSHRWQVDGRNKWSVTLDLKHPGAQPVFTRLLEWADVLVENLRPGKLAKLGFGWDTAHEINPRLVYVSISGWGQTGPRRDLPAFDTTAVAFAGLMSVTGYPDRLPVVPGYPVADYLAGTFGALGALEAIRRRDAQGGTGQGEWVDLGLYEPILRISSDAITAFAADGEIPQRQGSTPGPDGQVTKAGSVCFETKDGKMVTGFPHTDDQIRRLADLLGKPSLADPALLGPGSELARLGALDAVIRPWIAGLTQAEALQELGKADIHCSPVNRIDDIVQDPQVSARGNIVSLTNSRGERVAMQGVVPRFASQPGEVRWAGQELGASNDYVYRDIVGLDSDSYESLKDEGAI